MKFISTLLLLAGLTSLAVARANAELPPASIGVSPNRVELAVNNDATTGSTTVMNFTDKPIRVSTSVVNFDLDENSNFRELAPEAGSLPGAMMINPVDFTIPPRGSQTVRFAIMPERLEGAGEHRAMLFFSELVGTNEASVQLNFRLGVPIYAQLGERQQKAVLHAITIGTDHRLKLDMAAAGNAQIRPSGYYLWWPAGEFPDERQAFKKVKALADDPGKALPEETVGGRLVTKPIFPGARRTVTAKLTPPTAVGEYVLAVHIDAGDQIFQRAIRYKARTAEQSMIAGGQSRGPFK